MCCLDAEVWRDCGSRIAGGGGGQSQARLEARRLYMEEDTMRRSRES